MQQQRPGDRLVVVEPSVARRIEYAKCDGAGGKQKWNAAKSTTIAGSTYKAEVLAEDVDRDQLVAIGDLGVCP